LGALVGLALLRQPGALSRPAMFFVSLMQAWLLALLFIRSPFVRSAVAPVDGMGLNPLLEDPWMVIHPPILFLGYAALVAPFALAGAALVRNELREWNRMVWPWALFAVVTLGAGIALGGIWAYKTLGWGGYWGWDPVENASLIPWLVSVGLVHGLLIERTLQSLKRTNLILAMLSWVTVVGGTYLTRSGVLSDFSVHSFADEGLNAPLVGLLGVTALASVAMISWRWRQIGPGKATWTDLSRESALWLGLMTVLVLAAFVTVGTTAPLLTALFGKPASLDTKFYEYVSVPVGIVLILLMALAPALRWTHQQGLSWLRTLGPGAVGAVILPVALWIAGVHPIGALTLAAVSGLALGVNAAMSVRLFRRGWSYGAGYFVHVGIAVMVLGMVASAMLGKSQRVTLAPDRPVEVLGYTLTFQGAERGERGQTALPIRVTGNDGRFEARPVLVEMPERQGMVRRPAIDLRRDLYLSPIQVEAAAVEPIWIERGHDVTIGDTRVSFSGFRMESHEQLTVFADLRVHRNGQVLNVSPGIKAGASGSTPVPVDVPGLGAVQVVRIDADRGRVAVVFPGLSAGPTAIVEVSTKPLINLVWIGALLALFGSALAGVRRAVDRLPARAGRPGTEPSLSPGAPLAR
jgi:cytochrome c-type biogenesis protein CcmF